MAIIRIKSESMDLSDDYTFTGTVSGVSSGVGTVEGWVNFNGSGTVAISSSGNVSSITDNGTGDYSINFSTAISDSNYTYSATPIDINGVRNVLSTTNRSTTVLRLQSVKITGGVANIDVDEFNVVVVA